MNSILVAGCCGIAFAVGAILTLMLWGLAQSSKKTESQQRLDLEQRVVDQQDTVIAQRKVQLMILEEIRDALRGGAK